MVRSAAVLSSFIIKFLYNSSPTPSFSYLEKSRPVTFHNQSLSHRILFVFLVCIHNYLSSHANKSVSIFYLLFQFQNLFFLIWLNLIWIDFFFFLPFQFVCRVGIVMWWDYKTYEFILVCYKCFFQVNRQSGKKKTSELIVQRGWELRPDQTSLHLIDISINSSKCMILLDSHRPHPHHQQDPTTLTRRTGKEWNSISILYRMHGWFWLYLWVSFRCCYI